MVGAIDDEQFNGIAGPGHCSETGNHSRPGLHASRRLRPDSLRGIGEQLFVQRHL